MRHKTGYLLCLSLIVPLHMSCWWSGVSADQAHSTSPLFAYTDNGEWGYIKQSGEVAIEAQYADAHSRFAEGLAAVAPREDASPLKYGYIHRNGQWAIRPEFDYASVFKNGLAVVSMMNKWGLINKDGKYIVIPRYDFVSTGWGGRWPFLDGDRWGLLNREGQVVVPPKYTAIGRYSNGLANAAVTLTVDGREAIRWGYIDESGEFVIDPQYEDARPFNQDGIAAVADADGYFFINTAGEEVIHRRFRNAGPFSEGLAPVRMQGTDQLSRTGWAYVNREGKIAIPGPFTAATRFSNGRAAVAIEAPKWPDTWKYIDKSGRDVTEARFYHALPFEKGLAKVFRSDNVWQDWGWVNRKGELVGHVGGNGGWIIGHAAEEDGHD